MQLSNPANINRADILARVLIDLTFVILSVPETQIDYETPLNIKCIGMLDTKAQRIGCRNGKLDLIALPPKRFGKIYGLNGGELIVGGGVRI